MHNQKEPRSSISRQKLLEKIHALDSIRTNVQMLNATGVILIIPALISTKLKYNVLRLFFSETAISESESITVMIFAAALGFLTIIYSSFKFKEYRRLFKKNVVRNIFESIAPQLVYTPKKSISRDIYDNSRIFRQEYTVFEGDDLVKGKIGDTEVEFSDLHTSYLITKNTNNSTEDERNSIFKGLFFSADFHKHIKGETFILPDIAEKNLGVFGTFLQKNNPIKHAKHLILLENSEFEKEFAIYSSNQQEARYCLTPKMMEALLELKKTFPYSKMHCSIRGTRINIAISMENQFEPRLWQNGADPKHIDQMIELYTCLTSIVEQLDLNTRIWTKKAA